MKFMLQIIVIGEIVVGDFVGLKSSGGVGSIFLHFLINCGVNYDTLGTRVSAIAPLGLRPISGLIIRSSALGERLADASNLRKDGLRI